MVQKRSKRINNIGLDLSKIAYLSEYVEDNILNVHKKNLKEIEEEKNGEL